MLIRMHEHATAGQIQAMRDYLRSSGYRSRRVRFLDTPVFVAMPLDSAPEVRLEQGAGVAEVLPSGSTQLVRREWRPEGTRVRVGDALIGSDEFVVIAGPCSIESRDQLLETALAVRAAGAHLLRGGAYKPRTSTYSFQGLGRHGLEILAEARERTGLGVVTEVLSPGDVPVVADYADMIQVGARNMQNFPLLKRLGRLRKPVLLKRGAGATIEEWLAAAEYLLARGNDQVVLCERGIRTFETFTRHTLDISAVAAVHELSHLPIIVDPSHATGRRSLIDSASRAALAAGADGICVEVHVRPEQSVSDREQALSPEMLEHIMGGLRRLAPAVDRTLSASGTLKASCQLPNASSRKYNAMSAVSCQLATRADTGR